MASGGTHNNLPKMSGIDSEEEGDKKPQNVFDNMAALVLSERLADVYFICTDKDGNPERIPGHRVILCMWSDVYEIMLFGSLPEAQDITIADIPAEVFRQFLSFLYTDRCDNSLDVVAQLLYCGEKYMIKGLQKRCKAIIDTHLEHNNLPKMSGIDSEEEGDKKPQNVFDNMAALVLSERLADVYFICTDKDGNPERIPGHRVILCMWSDVYEIMLFGSLPEAQDITIADIPAEVFRQFLSFLYTDRCDNSIDVVAHLLYCGEKYMIKGLQKRCKAIIDTHLESWTPSTVLLLQDLIKIGKGETTQVEKCLQLIEEHAKWVLESEEFLNLEEDIVGLILQRDGLNCEEEVVFRATIKWSVKECHRQGLPVSLDNQRQVLVGLLHCIRFPTMTTDMLQRVLLECRILDDATILHIFLPSNNNALFNSTPRLCGSRSSYNKILLIGGSVNGRRRNEIYEYTVNEGCTMLDTKMIDKREAHAAGFHPRTRELIVAGGYGEMDQCESCILPFNTDSKFSLLPNMNQTRSFFSSCVMGNRFYVFGGCKYSFLSHCEFFGFSLRSWKGIAALPVPLANACAICWKNRNNMESIFVFGGRNDVSSSVDTVYQYNIIDNTWKHRQELKMPKPVCYHAIVNFNGKVIVCGGSIQGSDYSKSCHSLDMSTGVWSDFPSLNVGRYKHAAVVVGGQIVVMGGRGDGFINLKSVEVFNGTEWVMAKELDEPISSFSAVIV